MKKYFAILSVMVLFVFCSCTKPAGEPITKDFSIEGSYNELSVSSGFAVTVDEAATQVTVTAGENVIPYVVVENVNNTLRIYLKPNSISGLYELKVVMPYNADLKEVDLSGGSEFHSEYGLEGQKIEVEGSGGSVFDCDIDANKVDIELTGASEFYGNILAEEIEMELSGDSNIKGEVESRDLDIDLSGDSDASLEGEITNLKLNLSGGSNLLKKIVGDRYALACERCDGELSGASNAFVHCDNGVFRVSLSGASDLHYTGVANTTGCTTTGGSNIFNDVLP